MCWDVEVPTYRATKDVTLPVDLIEEVTRVYGYGNIEPKSKAVALSPIHQDEHIELHYRIKQMLSASFGMSEIHTYSWYDKDWNREIDHKDDSVLTIANPGISKTTRSGAIWCPTCSLRQPGTRVTQRVPPVRSRKRIILPQRTPRLPPTR